MGQDYNLELKVDTGAVTVPIVDEKDGELIGEFKFNPNDLDIVKRYEKVVEALESINLEEDADGDAILKVSDEIKVQIDYLLNYSVSSEIFAKCNPLTLTTDGDFFVEKVIEGIASLIEKVMDQRLKKKKAKIQKATAKYHK